MSSSLDDPFRNGFGATVVAPYSVRRREKAPFSAPDLMRIVAAGENMADSRECDGEFERSRIECKEIY